MQGAYIGNYHNNGVKMMMTECLLDMDGIIVDFVNSTCEFHGIPNPYTSDFEKYKGVYWLQEYSNVDWLDPLGKDFWVDMPWTKDGKQIFQIVLERFGKKNICILTNPSDRGEIAHGKIEWLRKHLPGYPYLIGSGKSFTSAPNRILIDDYDENIRLYAGPKILLPRPWNKNHGKNPIIYLEQMLEILLRRKL